MNRNVLQVPINPAVQASAKKLAKKQGVSLQDIVRLFLEQYARGNMVVRLTSADEDRLSPRATRRYARIAKEIKQGKGVTKTENVDELLRLLNA